MTAEELKIKSKTDVLDFIRERLSFAQRIPEQLRHVDEKLFKKEHRRFDMSGYEDISGENTVFNLSILNEFANLGIYDYTSYLFLDFYKGSVTLYLKYFYEQDNLEYDLSGSTTSEIIYEIFQRTIFSGRMTKERA